MKKQETSLLIKEHAKEQFEKLDSMFDSEEHTIIDNKIQDHIKTDKVQPIINDESLSIQERIQTIYNQMESLSNDFKDIFIERIKGIGFLLNRQKSVMGYGQFTKWVNDNLPFQERQARKYMAVYKSLKQLENQNGISNSVLESIEKNNLETVYKAIQKNLKQGSEEIQDEKQDIFSKWKAILESLDQYKIEKAFKSILNEKEKVEETITEKVEELKKLKEKLSKIKDFHSLYWKAKKKSSK